MWIALFIGAFFLGSIPFGYLVARSKGVDLRKVGSGNIGATNTIRAVGKPLGLTVFVLDVLKGTAPALLARYVVDLPPFLGDPQEFAFIAGFCAVVGHSLSPFLGFRGGKGVATGLGTMFGTTPILAAITFGIFLLGLGVTRYVSFSSMLAAAFMPFLGRQLNDPPTLIIAYGCLALFVILRHKTNIKNLLGGTERKFGFGSKQPEPLSRSVGEKPKDTPPDTPSDEESETDLAGAGSREGTA